MDESKLKLVLDRMEISDTVIRYATGVDMKDWDLYRTLVPNNGVITLHDTTNYRDPCGVPQLVDEIRESGEYDIVNFPLAYGLAIARKILSVEENMVASKASRTSAPGPGRQQQT